MQLREYIQGAINYLRASMRPTASVELAEHRYKQCIACTYRLVTPREKCAVCNCFLPHKTLLIEQSCPKGRW